MKEDLSNLPHGIRTHLARTGCDRSNEIPIGFKVAGDAHSIKMFVPPARVHSDERHQSVIRNAIGLCRRDPENSAHSADNAGQRVE